jgi:multisubunit Na+/H+ antiporter MnhE subunit
MLGGHPFWSASATYLGIGIGAVIALLGHLILLRHPRWSKLLLGLFVSIAVIGITAPTYGKIDFVASYAEDRHAGLIWYYGFIAFIAAQLPSATIGVQMVLRRKA